MNNEFNYNNGNNMMNNQQPMGNGIQPNNGFPQPQQDSNMVNNQFVQQPMYNQPPMQPVYNHQPMSNQGFNQPVFVQNNNSNSKSGISLFYKIIVAVAVIITFFAVIMMFGSSDEMTGSWQCTGTASLKFDFKRGNKFKIHNEGINENYIAGTYTRESAIGPFKNYTYYKYYFQATETRDNDGVKASSISQTYLIGVTSNRSKAVIYSSDGENYICNKK